MPSPNRLPAVEMERDVARRVLGLRSADNAHVRLKDRSCEALIVTIELQNKRALDADEYHKLGREHLLRKLTSERKARAKANARADAACKALRDAAETFASAAS
jgi:hypothetical protein